MVFYAPFDSLHSKDQVRLLLYVLKSGNLYYSGKPRDNLDNLINVDNVISIY